jgi:hypothetical protein
MRQFVVDAVERAAKTAAQAALLVIGADQANVLTLDWQNLAGFAGGGFLLSLLTSVASLSVGAPGTASLVAPEGD